MKRLVSVAALAAVVGFVTWGCNKKSSSTSSGSTSTGSIPTGANLTVGCNDNGSNAGGTVTSSPSGISCSCSGSSSSGTCGVKFSSGTLVSLSASPNGSSNFGGWGNGCSGSGSCSVTVGTNTVTVSAGFNASSGGTAFDGLAAGLAENDGTCNSAKYIDSSAVSTCGSECQSGSISYNTVNVTGNATQNPVTLGGSVVETYNSCMLNPAGSTTTLTLNGNVTVSYTNNFSLNFTPTSDFNNTSWTSIAITGSESFTAGPNFTVNGTSCGSTSVSQTVSQTVDQAGGGTNSDSFTGTGGCAANQSGTGILRASSRSF